MTTKASPVKVSFQFDSTAFYALSASKDENTASLIRLVHDAIKPGVTHADIAARIIHDNIDDKGNELRVIDEANIRMTVGHYAQTAALSLSHDPAGKTHFDSDASLAALYRIRTTGTADSRRAMVAAFEGKPGDPFVAYVVAWAKKTRAEVTASRSASADKSTAKVTKKDDAPKGLAAAPSDRPVTFTEAVNAMDAALRAEQDVKKLAEMVKAAQAVLNRAKARTIAQKVAA